MKTIYKIEVSLYPNNDIDASKPFFWCLKSCTGADWCMENAGWEASHEDAWEAAYGFYQKYKCEDSCYGKSAEELWNEFGDVPMNPETECIEECWYGFSAGTHREDIWHWFEETFHVSVHNLMYSQDK